jgi:hypothetical protein
MKFGKNLAVQQAKFPHLRYINYKDLKKTIKTNIDDAQLFNSQLQYEIEEVNACFSLNVSSIQTQLHSVSSDSDKSVSFRLCEIMRISEQVEVLRRFAVWSTVAVVKILKKRSKLLAGPVPPGLVPSSGSTQRPTSPFTPPEEWLSRQNFFSGSDFAELQASLESIAENLSRERLAELSAVGRLGPELKKHASPLVDSSETDRCPICLERCVDAVELSSCGHRFCWKCVVLGPIAFAPGEYRLSRCAVCRHEQPLDPTRNFKTVCSNQLERISALIDENHSSPIEWGHHLSLDDLYGTAGGGSKLVSEKERQAMDTIESHTSTCFFCALCCEPLLLEAVSTTPCKHHFHRVCLEKHSNPTCPLCSDPLPIELVTPRYQWSPPMIHSWIPYEMVPPQFNSSSVGTGRPEDEEEQQADSITYYSRLGPLKSFSRSLIEKKRNLAKNFSL